MTLKIVSFIIIASKIIISDVDATNSAPGSETSGLAQLASILDPTVFQLFQNIEKKVESNSLFSMPNQATYTFGRRVRGKKR